MPGLSPSGANAPRLGSRRGLESQRRERVPSLAEEVRYVDVLERGASDAGLYAGRGAGGENGETSPRDTGRGGDTRGPAAA
jgi:hypothetical protein